MFTKLQLKAVGCSKDDKSLFEEGKEYSAVCQDNLLLIDCEGLVVMECISEITNRHFEIISSVDVDSQGRLMIDELYNVTQTAEKFIPTLVTV